MTTMMILCLFCHCSCQLDTCLLAPFSSLAGLLSVTLVPYFSCCSFLTRTWLGCRSLAIIHLYFVFTQTPARIFLPPNTQNALPGWKPEVCSNFFLSCVSKTPRFLPYPGWKRELCPNFSWLAKKVWSPKNVKSFHPPPTRGPARIPASLRSAREGGAPFGGGWKDFTFFGLYIFCPAS